VRLDRERPSGSGAHRAAEEDVVAQDEVGREALPQGCRVGADPAVELGARAVLEELDLVALVAVEDEDRKEASDVRPDDCGTADVEPLRVRVLQRPSPRAPPDPRGRAGVCRRSAVPPRVPCQSKFHAVTCP
jgi:hypothetical protein